ncbi:hypothetical protein K1T71_003268 [Dendrolimus kikuchii]|uniref:Uncharacterized protein n=1 Tax=Dendrolimus kikuchii TaxID=765133 RepID=A0ACC1DC54_9NEOP|nr:hypothetical protein K1T71_003268 [Dendrolimus kikuchii]
MFQNSSNRKNAAFQNYPILKEPFIVGYMSVNESREYYSNLTQLKFLNSIPMGRLSLNLNHNIEKAKKRTTENNNEKIDLLLKFLLDQKHRINFQDTVFTFITYRRTLISVMCSAFGNSESLYIMATLYKNCIYLCSLDTEHDIQKRQSRSKQQDKFCAWGYKFEQYILSDLPDLQPDIEKPVKENEEFSLYYYSELNTHTLLYGAQIDGLLATNNCADKPLKANDVNAILNYLRSHSFVELKTNRVIQHWKQEQNFKKYKLLRCWCQCYLANLKGLLVGFRNDDGIIQRLQWYDTEELVHYCKDEWDPGTALQYLNYFLTFVKDSFRNEIKQCSPNKPVSLQFHVDNKNISVSTKYSEEDVILPDWFINNL